MSVFEINLARRLVMTVEAPDEQSLERALNAMSENEIAELGADDWFIDSVNPAPGKKPDAELHDGKLIDPSDVPVAVNAVGAPWLEGLTVPRSFSIGHGAVQSEGIACWTDSIMAIAGPATSAESPRAMGPQDTWLPVILAHRKECLASPGRRGRRVVLLDALRDIHVPCFSPAHPVNGKLLTQLLQRLDGAVVAVHEPPGQEKPVLLVGETRWAMLMPMRHLNPTRTLNTWLD